MLFQWTVNWYKKDNYYLHQRRVIQKSITNLNTFYFFSKIDYKNFPSELTIWLLVEHFINNSINCFSYCSHIIEKQHPICHILRVLSLYFKDSVFIDSSFSPTYPKMYVSRNCTHCTLWFGNLCTYNFLLFVDTTLYLIW